MCLEKGFKLNNLTKRTDILIYKKSKVRILVECKAPQIELSQNVLDQAVRYNMNYEADYLLISNGLKHYCAKEDSSKSEFTFLTSPPDYASL